MATCRHVSHADAAAFLRKCRAKPERMRIMCSKKANREGGDELRVTVEIAPGGPTVEVSETSMKEGWTGHRFSPCALWLSLALAQRAASGECFRCRGGSREDVAEASHALRPRCCQGPRPSCLELGSGVALAGLSAHALGFDTTVTDCLPGHLANLAGVVGRREEAGPPADASQLRVRCLDWLEGAEVSCAVDRGSPENVGVSAEWERLSREEERCFDLLLASDVLYEEHHAQLLPQVVARWLRPGGRWMLAFAIRDAPMLIRFFERMRTDGLLPEASDGACVCSWQTACAPGRCDFCDAGGGDGVGCSSGDRVAFSRLAQIIEGHEGGAILVEGVRPMS